MKKILFAVLALLAGTCAFAGPHSFIRITNMESGDYNYFYNVENPQAEENILFKGEVSTDCVSVRVIWAANSVEIINQYLLNGNKAFPGEKVDDFTLSKYVKGSSSFNYYVNYSLDNLVWGSNYYRFIAKFSDGTYKTYTMVYYAHQGGAAERGKPVIYLYPEKTQDVKVSVKPQGGVTVSIPEMGKQWKVTASPDGTLFDKKTKQEYPYLFWESKDKEEAIDMSRGFVTPVAELDSFFKEKLAALGLNEKEIADFNEYWLPSIEAEGKPYVFITFHDQKTIDEDAPLIVSPKPDSVIRVYFDHKVLDEAIDVEPQTLSANERKGFAVVEWGGRLYR